MASYYVYSGAAGTNNGSSWANAYTSLATAFSGKAAGDVFYVAHDHAESAAGVTLGAPGTASNPVKVICVNRSGSVPPVSADRRATATITASGGNNININGSTHYDGIIFIAGTGSSSSGALVFASTSNCSQRFDNCSLQLAITVTGSNIYLAGPNNSLAACYCEFNNTTMSFANAGHQVLLGGVTRWRNTPSALLGTAPTLLFLPTSPRGGSLDCIGVDFSAAGSGKTLVDTNNTTQGFAFRFTDCKLNAAVTKDNATATATGATTVDFLRSGSSGVNYTLHRSVYAGTLDQETTIVRSGGASDGTTPISWKILTSANSTYSLPFECPPIAIWNDTTGSSVTATIEGIWGGGAVPNDNDVWVDVEYLGDASSPQASFVNDGTADLLTTAAAQTSSTATWGGSTTKFKLNVSFTAQQKGWLYARVKCAKASGTFYIDPLVTLT
jgi:hypothetical protein